MSSLAPLNPFDTVIHGGFSPGTAGCWIGVCGRALVNRGYEPVRQGEKELSLECVDALLRLLSIPLRSLGLGVLSLAEYMDLLMFLPWESQKQVGWKVGGRLLG